MHKLRCFLAFMFAILIASPACCCLAADPPQSAAHSCCGGQEKGKEKKESLCDCASRLSKVAGTDQPVPPAPVAALPAVPEISIPSADLPLIRPVAPITAELDTGPPPLGLAMLQRFLI